MTKEVIAQYLVNLVTLLDAQSANIHNPSATLSAEYDKYWDLLKQTVQKEHDDETRKRNDNPSL